MCSFWTLVTPRAIETFQVPVIADALKSSIAVFHTVKIIVTDPTKFHYIGSIPETMSRCVTSESRVMVDYRKLPPLGPRQLTPEMKSAFEAADKLAKRGKKPESKKDENEGPLSPKKQKADTNAPSSPKKKKVKNMEKRPKAPTPSDSDEEE